MQQVSQAYREGMQSHFRGRGYMRVVFGVVSLAAQETAQIQTASFYPESREVFLNGDDSTVYATLEENFTKVDGTHKIAIDEPYIPWQETAFVSDGMISDGSFTMMIMFPEVVSFNTIRFNFGDNYPTDFTLTDNTGHSLTVSNNARLCQIDEVFEDITTLSITVREMKNTISRFRIYSIDFGDGKVFENDDILDSSLDTSMSPVNEHLPQIDFSVTLRNEDYFFELENPQSYLNMLDTSTSVDVYYGYEISEGNIEWLQSAHVYAYDWGNNRESATINCKDILQINNTIYNNGVIQRTSLYDLAVDVFSAMGVSNYEIDPAMREMYTDNPIPRVACKEALQIIANAARMRLVIKRDGGILIGGPYLISHYLATCNGEWYTDGLSQTALYDKKYVYAELEQDLIKVDGSIYLAPMESFVSWMETGYVSASISDARGIFQGADANITVPSFIKGSSLTLPYMLEQQGSGGNTIPAITLSFGESTALHGIEISFERSYAAKVKITGYLHGVETLSSVISNNKNVLKIGLENNEFTEITVNFLQTAVGNNRVYISRIGLIPCAYDFSKNDMMSYPSFSKFDQVKEIVVPYFQYSGQAAEEEELCQQTIDVDDVTREYTFYFDEPAKDYGVTSTGTITVLERKPFYVTVRFASVGSWQITIKGRKYNKTKLKTVLMMHDKGSTVKWENPLIATETDALNLASWLSDYYERKAQYTFQTRGNPELDPFDEAYQTNYKGDLVKVLIVASTLNFNGAWSGEVTTLRLED